MSLINAVWTVIEGVIEQAMNFIRGAIQAALFIISGNWEEAWNLITDTARNIWEAFQNFMRDAGPKLWEIIQNIVRQIPNIISSIGNKLLEVGRNIVEKLKQGVSDAWGAFTQWFKDKLEGLTSWLPFSEPKAGPKSPLYGLSRAGEAIVNNIADGMQAAIGQLDNARMEMATAAAPTAIAGTRPYTGPGGTVGRGMVSVRNRFQTNIYGGIDQATFETNVKRIIGQAAEQAS